MESYKQRQTNSLPVLKHLLILWFCVKIGYISTTSHIYLTFLIRIISAHTAYNSYGPWRFAQWMLFVSVGDRLFVTGGYNIFIFKKFSNGKTDVVYLTRRVVPPKGCSTEACQRLQNFRTGGTSKFKLIQFWDCYASEQKLRSIAVLPVSSQKYRHRS